MINTEHNISRHGLYDCLVHVCLSVAAKASCLDLSFYTHISFYLDLYS